MRFDKIVSICCLSYNHKKYIKLAIDGFLSQKTDFDFEIIIHDDASDDGTQEILKNYEFKYPNLIKVLKQSENVYSKGINPLSHFVFPIARGKYIALCEGDDYWTDPYKLQKQAEILESCPQYSLTFTARNVVDSNNNITRIEHYPNKIYTTEDVVNGFIPATQTILMRNYRDFITFRKRYSSYPSGDRLIAYYCSLMGDIHYLDEVTACYRESGEGVWSSFDYWQKREKRFERFREFYRILGIEKNNLNLIDRGFYEFYSRVLSGLKKPVKTLFKLKFFYKTYLEKTPALLIITVVYLRVREKLSRFFKTLK